jgi:hypothetical protein
MNTTLLLLADISAPRLADARSIAKIVATCATDVGVAVQTTAHAPRKHVGAANITLHLPAEFAADQHPAWCLACRLACFCPDTRVGVLVHSESAFQRVVRQHRLAQTS